MARGLSAMGDVDLLNTYLGPFGRFLDTGLGTLSCVVIGAVIVGSAIIHRERRALGKQRNDDDTTEKIQGAVGVALPPAKYTKAEIRAILEAISAFHPELVELEKILMDGLGTALSMEAIIRDRGAIYLLEQMDQLRLRLIVPIDRIKAALHKFSLYREVCNVMNGFEATSDAFFGAYNDMTAMLRELPDKLSAPALKMFVEARKQTFITRTDQYLGWTKQKKLALENYREWYLRRETTD